MLQKVRFAPGFNKQVTATGGEGQWVEGDNVRFRYGTPEKIGGWSQLVNINENELTGAGRGISDYFTNRARKEIYNQVTSEMIATGTFKPDGIYRDSNGMLHGNFTENVTIARSSGKSIFDTSEEELTKIFKNFSFNKIITNQAKVNEYLKKLTRIQLTINFKKL